MTCHVPRPTRRAVLGSAMALLGVTACEPLGYIQRPPPGRGVLTVRRAIASEEALLARYAAVRREHSSLADLLGPLAADHHEHLRALRERVVGGSPTASASASPTASASASPTPTVPSDAEQAVAFVAAAERRAAKLLLEALDGAPGSLAQLLASIGAAETTHAALLRRKARHPQ